MPIKVATPDVETVARLKVLRILKGWTQSELAFQANVPVWRVHRMERNYLRLNHDELLRIIHCLSTSEGASE